MILLTRMVNCVRMLPGDASVASSPAAFTAAFRVVSWKQISGINDLMMMIVLIVDEEDDTAAFGIVIWK